MHILELPAIYTPYGGEFCLEQAKALKALGHEVRIIAPVQISIRFSKKKYFTFPYRTKRLTNDNITVFRKFLRGIPKAVKLNQLIWTFTAQRMVKKYIQKYGKPDIIHCHCGKWAGYVGYKLKKEFGIPFVITEHISELALQTEFKFRETNVWQIPLLKETYENADMVLPVAAELVDRYEKYFGKNYKWQEMSNIVDVDFFHFKKRDYTKPYKFCCIAHNDYRKGYDILIPAFSKVLESNPNCELHIAGKRTELLNIQNIKNITIHGNLGQNDVRELLYQCHSLVLPSRSEVQPLCFLEAMSTGIPIITTPCIPQNSIIPNACTIVPFDDIDSLANAMLKNSLEKFENGEQLSNTVRSICSAEAIGPKLVKVFQSIIKNTQPT